MGKKLKNTKSEILAAGMVKIVKTPEQLTLENSWWPATKQQGSKQEIYNAFREGMSDGLPKWLKPPLTPKQESIKLTKATKRANKKANEYIGDQKVLTLKQMTPAQQASALRAIAKQFPAEEEDNDSSN